MRSLLRNSRPAANKPFLIGLDKAGFGIEFVDVERRCSVHRIQTSTAPHDLVLSRDGARAYITLYGDGVYKSNPNPGDQILVLDLESRTVIDTISLAPFHSPHGITLDAQGLLWVTCDPRSRVLALCPDTGEIVSEIDTGNDGTHWVLASPVRNLLFCSSKEHRVLSVIDPMERTLLKQIETPHGTEGIAFGPDGTLYAADHKRPQVLVIDGLQLKVIAAIALQITPFPADRDSHHMRLAVSNDGRTLAVAAYHHDLLILVDLSDTRRQLVMKTGAGPMALEFSQTHDQTLFLSNHDEGTLSIVNLEQGRIEDTFACGRGLEALRVIAG